MSKFRKVLLGGLALSGMALLAAAGSQAFGYSDGVRAARAHLVSGRASASALENAAGFKDTKSDIVTGKPSLASLDNALDGSDMYTLLLDHKCK